MSLFTSLTSSVKILERSQTLAMSLDDAWGFFSDPRNLPEITPAELGFKIKTELPEEMYPGLMVAYTVTPMLGIPMTWVTEITQVKHKEYFVDEQRIGPYKVWHHEHFFKQVGDKVEIRDLVHYIMPFGPIGELVDHFQVGPQLQQIFDFRQKVLSERFKTD